MIIFNIVMVTFIVFILNTYPRYCCFQCHFNGFLRYQTFYNFVKFDLQSAYVDISYQSLYNVFAVADVIPVLDGGLTQPPLKLRQGLVITSNYLPGCNILSMINPDAGLAKLYYSNSLPGWNQRSRLGVPVREITTCHLSICNPNGANEPTNSSHECFNYMIQK